jgi:poly(hydroxyalkanoate) depolymerase family esterase
MKKDFLAGLIEATALTRAGNLSEATALIQRSLQRGAPIGRPSAAPERPVVDDVIDVEFSETALSTAGPARTTTTGQAGEFVAGTYAGAAGQRAYKLFLPPGHDGQSLPLIVMLHGCKQTPDDFALGTQMNEVAATRRCFVLYPAQSSAANQSRCWNWFRREDQVRDQGEPSIIAGMTREIVSRYRIAPRKVYVAGLSAGGAMAAVMGVTYPELYSAIGIHSGLACGSAHDLPSALAAMRGMPASVRRLDPNQPVIPTIVFHGDRDRTVHPRNGEHLASRSADGADRAQTTTERGQVSGGHAYTRTIHRNAAGQVVLEHWLVHGAGHAWFGGNPRGSYSDPRGPYAATEMARFFLEANVEANERR